MSTLALIHVVAIAFWLGVISVEIIFERANIANESKIVLHKLTDRFVELPIVTVVLISGAMLWQQTGWSLDHLVKVLLGITAISSNVICYYFVEKRSIDKPNYYIQSYRILWITIPGMLCLVAALYLGGISAGWW